MIGFHIIPRQILQYSKD